ncbi:hypothetical protein [Candidatus Berkiella aquae]|uniref:Uncharacterized protein n=1 Tax=Candidatus Berkiella aquae TaxID=295108 RepID=A0A0Q9YY62_9GAMM|nr:hypothetical protein [Candidatus Berkiella aquae]MCS5711236.1 hypothetical protein [Candidatus Berkiella aquae]
MKLNNTEMLSLSNEQTLAVGGGFSLTTLLMLIEIPHAILIARETTNYVGKLWVEGCEGIAQDDYFTQFFCQAF